MKEVGELCRIRSQSLIDDSRFGNNKIKGKYIVHLVCLNDID